MFVTGRAKVPFSSEENVAFFKNKVQLVPEARIQRSIWNLWESSLIGLAV